jgi:selenocysteine lyase/cysteine desulfurase
VTLGCVGDDLTVPLVGGGVAGYANLDLAASAPALQSVKAAVDEFLPWYSSVHRGTGFKSMIATEAYEFSRDAVRAFLRARTDDATIFTRNTTDATNMLARALPDDTEVVVFATEHHANLLPWRRRAVRVLAPPESPEAAVVSVERALQGGTAARPRLVAVTGASNVTGELWPVREMAAVAHRQGARVFLDAAQLAPHHPIDVSEWDVDYVAFSGHKLYAPYGAGVLAGRRDWLGAGDPYLAGGGAVEFVTTEDVFWTGLPDRQEAGSPNVVGAVALAAACRSLATAGIADLAAREDRLLRRLLAGLDAVPGVERYSMWGPDSDRIGVVTFRVGDLPYGLVAAALSAEHGIGVRHGCFCAHPLMLHLLRVDSSAAAAIRQDLRDGRRPVIPGAVRASIGLTTTAEHVDRLVAAVESLACGGPRWRYERVEGTDDYVPTPDTRLLPKLRALLPSAAAVPGSPRTLTCGGVG